MAGPESATMLYGPRCMLFKYHAQDAKLLHLGCQLHYNAFLKRILSSE